MGPPKEGPTLEVQLVRKESREAHMEEDRGGVGLEEGRGVLAPRHPKRKMSQKGGLKAISQLLSLKKPRLPKPCMKV